MTGRQQAIHWHMMVWVKAGPPCTDNEEGGDVPVQDSTQGADPWAVCPPAKFSYLRMPPFQTRKVPVHTCGRYVGTIEALEVLSSFHQSHIIRHVIFLHTELQ